MSEQRVDIKINIIVLKRVNFDELLLRRVLYSYGGKTIAFDVHHQPVKKRLL